MEKHKEEKVFIDRRIIENMKKTIISLEVQIIQLNKLLKEKRINFSK